LKVTDNDIRRTALQYQIAKGSDGLLDPCERFFMSIPALVCEQRTEKEQMEWYSLLCDIVLWADFDFAFFGKFMRGFGARLFSDEREITFRDRIELISTKIPCTHCSDFDAVEMLSLASVACKNADVVTGNASVPVLSGRHSMNAMDVEDVCGWGLWPLFEKELNLEKKKEERNCLLLAEATKPDLNDEEVKKKVKMDRRTEKKKKTRKNKGDSDSEWLPG
jgi:hypothetical protein